jgi:hypothetical protein
MNARTETIRLPQRRMATLPWVVAILEGLVIAALVAAIVLVRAGSPSTRTIAGSSVPQVLSHVAAAQVLGADYGQYGISGTGPALALIGTWSRPASAVRVTGTGPGLMQVAGSGAVCHPGWCPSALQN